MRKQGHLSTRCRLSSHCCVPWRGCLFVSQTKSTGDLFSHVKPKVLNNSCWIKSFQNQSRKEALHSQVGSSTSMIYTRALSLLYINAAACSVFNTQKKSNRNISKEATFRDTIEINPVPSPFLWNYLKNGPLVCDRLSFNASTSENETFISPGKVKIMKDNENWVESWSLNDGP